MKINWPRLIVGGLIAAIICFLSDGFFHEQLFGRDWEAVYSNLGIAEPPHQTSAMLYFAIFELGRGFVSMLLYVMMRTPFGPGPKTAALAGIAAWVAFSLTAPAQFIPLGFFSTSLWLKVGALQLLTSIVATIAGAALYKDAAGRVASPAT
jgi:hypothetical protein